MSHTIALDVVPHATIETVLIKIKLEGSGVKNGQKDPYRSIWLW